MSENFQDADQVQILPTAKRLRNTAKGCALWRLLWDRFIERANPNGFRLLRANEHHDRAATGT